MIRPVDPSDDAHPKSGQLRRLWEKYTDGKTYDMRGFVRVMCIDEGTAYMQGSNGRTMVPRANNEGGILGHKDLNDRKYGDGVTRRVISCHMRPIHTEEGFRPDTGKKLEPMQKRIPKPGQDEANPLTFPPPELDLEEKFPLMSKTTVTTGDRLEGMVRWITEQCEMDEYEKGISSSIEEYELRLPRELYEEFKDGFIGYPVVYGIAGEVTLRHKQSGITNSTKWESSWTK